MEQYAPPLQIHVVWHPDSDEECRPIAELIYRRLNRDPFNPLLPALGVPVHYRCAGQDPGQRKGAPMPILAGAAKLDLRIFLLTGNYFVNPDSLSENEDWIEFRDKSRADAAADPRNVATVEFALRPGLAQGGALVVEVQREDDVCELVVRHTALQACRLISGRSRKEDKTRGAAPLNLFLSHTKRDPFGEAIAKWVKRSLEELGADSFFDRVSIQPGDSISDTLAAEIRDAALVAIRTDNYVASPWCRQEVHLAKVERRPIVVIDALQHFEARSSSLLANLPSVRLAHDFPLDPDEALAEPDPRTMWKVTNFIGLEVLRYLFAARYLAVLKDRQLVPSNTILLARPPEARDIGEMLQHAAKTTGDESPPVFLYPDPVIGAEEMVELTRGGARLVTPDAIWIDALKGQLIGISVGTNDSNRQHDAALGLSPDHIEDAARLIARRALAAGAAVVYGGNPDEKMTRRNLTFSLFEMIAHYNRSGKSDLQRLVNVVAWPFWKGISADFLAAHRSVLKFERLDPPDAAAGREGEAFPSIKETGEGRALVGISLSEMRRRLAEKTDAQIFLGGARTGFLGLYPGVVEEVFYAIERRKPIYVLGGFDGAAALVADALRGDRPAALTLDGQVEATSGYEATLEAYDRLRTRHVALPSVDYNAVFERLRDFGVKGLADVNGLTVEENELLLSTQSLEACIHYFTIGITSLR